MAILLNRSTRVIVQGFTGKIGSFHAEAERILEAERDRAGCADAKPDFRASGSAAFLIRSAHPAQHFSQRRIVSRLAGSKGHGPLHLLQGVGSARVH